ncbi:arylsulfatase I-like [Myripristis murdjan]|uniref:arylsulfatase I-like n=1 Tax=Myripristis murdjan TaxID=586833 RepID=UPI001175D68C|nr:arylsulfatase I-like [Myripristis murdjan]
MHTAAASVAAAAAVCVCVCVLSLTAAHSTHNLMQDQEDAHTQSHEASGEQKRQPHIIFILTDDQGYNDIGYHNPSIKTPTLDKLAAEGVRLENYYVQPICTPSRSQLMTGRYQIHTGLQHSIIRPRQPSCLPSHMDTLPQRLQQAGYATHMVGKWHLGFYRKACLPTRKGFDSFFGSLTGSVGYYSYGSCDGPGLCGFDLHDDEDVAWGQGGRYSTLLYTQRVRKILERHDPTARPLFLLLSLQAVHTPLQPPKSYIYPYRDMTNVVRRKFAAMVSTVDEAVRNVTYALRKFGYYRNSVIIYSTDNGAQPFTGGSNWPLRGRKGTYWEGGVRGVAFVHSPLLRRRRRVSNALLHITDWFPTLVNLAGGNVSQSQGLDGFDVWPAISEGKESPRHEILHNIDPLHKPAAPMKAWADHKTAPGKKKKGASGTTIKAKASKKPKKKVKKQQPKQWSKFGSKLKTSLEPWDISQHVPKPKPKSRPLLKAKIKPKTQKTKFKPKPRPLPKAKIKPKAEKSKLKPLSKSQVFSQPEPVSLNQLHVRSQSGPSLHQNLSLSGPPRPKSQTQTHPHFKSKPKRDISQYQNLSLSGTPHPDVTTRPTPPLTLQSSQSAEPVWDTSVQAAIRVGDWKLLTGDPGHGDWVPPQVVSSLPGRWWNLERAYASAYKTAAQKTVWLFNITDDPYERWDLAERRPDVVQRLLARLAFYNQTAVPVYFPPDDPRANPDRHGGAWVPWVDEDEEEEQYKGVYEKGKTRKKKKREKKRKKKCMLCKLKSFFMNLNTQMMSNRI